MLNMKSAVLRDLGRQTRRIPDCIRLCELIAHHVPRRPHESTPHLTNSFFSLASGGFERVPVINDFECIETSAQSWTKGWWRMLVRRFLCAITGGCFALIWGGAVVTIVRCATLQTGHAAPSKSMAARKDSESE
mmetsp:Transcript_113521/g.360819  ORF Transcript_113521/g.360819 Transcript_113521/m.360819 type:complete len:134 (+) Transcript_113521:608-1009(+)